MLIAKKVVNEKGAQMLQRNHASLLWHHTVFDTSVYKDIIQVFLKIFKKKKSVILFFSLYLRLFLKKKRSLLLSFYSRAVVIDRIISHCNFSLHHWKPWNKKYTFTTGSIHQYCTVCDMLNYNEGTLRVNGLYLFIQVFKKIYCIVWIKQLFFFAPHFFFCNS